MDAFLENLVRSHMQLARSIAVRIWKTAPHALDVKELEAIAYEALSWSAKRWPDYCAENNFDPERTEYFRTVASRRVNGAIYDSFRTQDWASRALRVKYRKLVEAGAEKGVDADLLAERTGMSLKDVRQVLWEMSCKPVSLEDEEVDPELVLDVEGEASEHSLLEVVSSTVEALSEEQKAVLALRYYRGLELQTVAQRLELPSSQVSQLHASAVEAVRKALLAAVDTRQL